MTDAAPTGLNPKPFYLFGGLEERFISRGGSVCGGMWSNPSRPSSPPTADEQGRKVSGPLVVLWRVPDSVLSSAVYVGG